MSQFLLTSTIRVFCDGTSTVRWDGCLNLRTKRTKRTVSINAVRFMCNMWPSIAIVRLESCSRDIEWRHLGKGLKGSSKWGKGLSNPERGEGLQNIVEDFDHSRTEC